MVSIGMVAMGRPGPKGGLDGRDVEPSAPWFSA